MTEELPNDVVEALNNIHRDIQRMFTQLDAEQVNALLMVGAKHAYFRGVKDTKEMMIKEFNAKVLKTAKELKE